MNIFGQSRVNVTLTVAKYKDTLKTQKDYNTTLKLCNNDSFPIVICDENILGVYFKYVYLNSGNKDTVNTDPQFQKMDAQPVSQSCYERLEGNATKEKVMRMFGSFGRSGAISIKFIYRFADHNYNIHEVESDWIQQYLCFTYSELVWIEEGL